MHRREFIKIGVAMSASTGIAGCIGGGNLIDVSIFMTDEVQEESLSEHSDPFFPTKLIGAAATPVLRTIPGDGESIDVNIRTPDTVLPEDDLPIKTERPAHDWENAIDSFIPKEERGDDCNLLLMAEQTGGLQGQARIPCMSGCDPKNFSSAVTLNADHFSELTWDDKEGPWKVRSVTEGIIVTSIHEIGHTLGLQHTHGAGKSGELATETDDGESIPAEVTPMLGRYIFNDDYQDIENEYGEQLPESPGGNDAICLETFNPKMTLSDIVTADRGRTPL